MPHWHSLHHSQRFWFEARTSIALQMSSLIFCLFQSFQQEALLKSCIFNPRKIYFTFKRDSFHATGKGNKPQWGFFSNWAYLRRHWVELLNLLRHRKAIKETAFIKTLVYLLYFDQKNVVLSPGWKHGGRKDQQQSHRVHRKAWANS